MHRRFAVVCFVSFLPLFILSEDSSLPFSISASCTIWSGSIPSRAIFACWLGRSARRPMTYNTMRIRTIELVVRVSAAQRQRHLDALSSATLCWLSGLLQTILVSACSPGDIPPRRDGWQPQRDLTFAVFCGHRCVELVHGTVSSTDKRQQRRRMYPRRAAFTQAHRHRHRST